jgi:hypothetical protein
VRRRLRTSSSRWRGPNDRLASSSAEATTSVVGAVQPGRLAGSLRCRRPSLPR